MSVEGWEPAEDARKRVLEATETVLAGDLPRGDVLLVGHGAVGTLLMTGLLGAPISRALDQPGGGGHVFAFDAATRRVFHRWLPLEAEAVGVLG